MCIRDSCINRIKIMSVNVDYMEIERLKFLIDRVWRVYFINRAINLKIVVIYDYYQVVQLSVSRKHSCLPYLTFLNLTISEQLSLIHI